ncbi:Adenosine deaminase [Taphrina deformans PYCC 5710]|uniref:Adenine deaminase n=1 Tax=Taphrina deformans (strain PYCC 5710 / ATCC 11124 / CBS 356.35 / IMI 108563 / JCM 9778 / NBRC 8474) TaxID=1097556 RepID=R4X6E2_TAPDE|nr:Adenosine deaminase [Taphrina deformans PYCC 5710]|eukprot:CCG80615.1 Adenosine deaminase [Taphrina deformans PYCC 5710]
MANTMHEFLCALPKCEHHIHIEGSLSPTLLFSLSEKNEIALPKDDAAFGSIAALEARYTEFKDLQDFLDYYYLAMSTLLTMSDFEDLMYAYLKKAVSDGLMHAEIFFDPQAHTDRGVALETVVRGLERGIERAEAEWDVSADLIMCFLRHLPQTLAIDTFEAARSGQFLTTAEARRKIVGVGLDSAELPFPPELFTDVYAAAGEAGLHRTAHAGEEGPAAYIATSLDSLHVERIDHGIKLIQDPSLLARVAEQGTMLTVCPLSNVRLRAVKSVAEVPIKQFLHAGVRFSINSDDPAYFGGYILDNYLAVQEAHSLTKAEWLTIVRNSVEGSWCTRDRKAQIMDKIEQVSARFVEL